MTKKNCKLYNIYLSLHKCIFSILIICGFFSITFHRKMSDEINTVYKFPSLQGNFAVKCIPVETTLADLRTRVQRAANHCTQQKQLLQYSLLLRLLRTRKTPVQNHSDDFRPRKETLQAQSAQFLFARFNCHNPVHTARSETPAALQQTIAASWPHSTMSNIGRESYVKKKATP